MQCHYDRSMSHFFHMGNINEPRVSQSLTLRSILKSSTKKKSTFLVWSILQLYFLCYQG
jgi:hypothetical protein